MINGPLPQPADWPKNAIFTSGIRRCRWKSSDRCSKRTPIECLADIPTVPRSRYNPQFNHDTLGNALCIHKIDYLALPALGDLRHLRKESPNTGWRDRGFAVTPIICNPANSRTGSTNSSCLACPSSGHLAEIGARISGVSASSWG